MPQSYLPNLENDTDNLPDPDDDLDNGLSQAQNRAIMALISTSSQTEAAAKAGVGRTTLYRWQKDPAFRREYLEMRNRTFSAAVGRAQRMADGSIKRLDDFIKAENSTGAALISAIRLNLDFACRGMELDNLDLRIATLEDIAAQNEKLSKG